MSVDPKVQHVLLNMPQMKLRTVLGVRAAVFSFDRRLKETVRMGRITYVRSGKPIAFICSCPGESWIELGFFHDVPKSSRSLLHRRNGKSTWRMKIQSPDQMQVEEIRKLLRESTKPA
jgi:hypothetical protein